MTLAAPVGVTDDRASVTCTQPPDGALSPAEATSCSASYTVTQADLDAGRVTNVATAAADGVVSAEASATATATAAPALVLEKAVSPLGYAAVGDVLAYAYTVTNTGNVTLAAPVGVTDDRASVTCTQPPDGALSPAEATSCSASYTVTQADLDAGRVTNVATAAADGVVSAEASATATATAAPALVLEKAVSPLGYAAVGDVLAYAYTVTNTGNVTLAAPVGVTDDRASVTCTQPPDGALSPAEATSCSASYTVTQADLDAGRVTNVATAAADGVVSAEASATATATAAPALVLEKAVEPARLRRRGRRPGAMPTPSPTPAT